MSIKRETNHNKEEKGKGFYYLLIGVLCLIISIAFFSLSKVLGKFIILSSIFEYTCNVSLAVAIPFSMMFVIEYVNDIIEKKYLKEKHIKIYTTNEALKKVWIPGYKSASKQISIIGENLEATVKNLTETLNNSKRNRDGLKINIILSNNQKKIKNTINKISLFKKIYKEKHKKEINLKVYYLNSNEIKNQIVIIDNCLTIIPYSLRVDERPVLYTVRNTDNCLFDIYNAEFYNSLKEAEKNEKNLITN